MTTLDSIMSHGSTMGQTNTLSIPQKPEVKTLNSAHFCPQMGVFAAHARACVYNRGERGRKKTERETLRAMGGVDAAAFREGKQL